MVTVRFHAEYDLDGIKPISGVGKIPLLDYWKNFFLFFANDNKANNYLKINPIYYCNKPKICIPLFQTRTTEPS